MNEALHITLALIVGLVLGTIFFGGLWLTIKKAVTSKTPAIWFLGSFVVRVGITLIGFYFISFGNWQRMVICLFGFIVARIVITRLTKTKKISAAEFEKEVSYEA